MNARLLLSLLGALAFFVGTETSYGRWMDTRTGRFHTLDKFEGKTSEPLSLHKYLYAQDNPVNLLDPSGEQVAVYSHIVARGLPFSHANLRLYPDDPNSVPRDLLTNV